MHPCCSMLQNFMSLTHNGKIFQCVCICMYVCVCVCVYIYDTICLAIHPAMDIFIVSTFWPPWILLLWTYMYMLEYNIPVLISFKYLPRSKMVGLMFKHDLYLAYWGTTICHDYHTILFSTSNVPISLYLYQHLLLSH